MKRESLKVEFSKPPRTAKALEYIQSALTSTQLAGDGLFTKACQTLLQTRCGAREVFLTPSCTAALEMAMVVAGVGPGDEVIVPSFTFSSTANSAALLGATPVFVDIEPGFLNIDPACIAAAVTKKTKVIVPVHYAGVACDMAAILKIAEDRGVSVIEDAAQAIGAKYHDHYLGTMGRFGALSFHETKNLGCGEGGALFSRDVADLPRAEIARDKGTNRKTFLRGQIDKYTWVDTGSSYLISEVTAALLLAQLEDMEAINARRLALWDFYHQAAEASPWISRIAHVQKIPNYATHNAHIFFLILPTHAQRDLVLKELREAQVFATSHYEPLHLSPGGVKFGRVSGSMTNSETITRRLLRLPLYADMERGQAEYVISVLENVLKRL